MRRAGRRGWRSWTFSLFDRAALAEPRPVLPPVLRLADRHPRDPRYFGVDEYWNAQLGRRRLHGGRYVERHCAEGDRRAAGAWRWTRSRARKFDGLCFRSDSFGMLRSWHNSRAAKPVRWKLDLALVTFD